MFVTLTIKYKYFLSEYQVRLDEDGRSGSRKVSNRENFVDVGSPSFEDDRSFDQSGESFTSLSLIDTRGCGVVYPSTEAEWQRFRARETLRWRERFWNECGTGFGLP